jgi:hypothetical protein
MVQAPKCKVCGESHFGAAHIWKGPAPSEPTRSVSGKAVSPARALPLIPRQPDDKDQIIAELRARIAQLERDAASTERRRLKQRELMQRRRAKA